MRPASPLLIAGTAYLCVELPPESVAVLFRLVKLDFSGYYHVHNEGAYWGCDCADFMYRRDGLDPMACKHVRAVREMLGCPTWTIPAAADTLMQEYYDQA